MCEYMISHKIVINLMVMYSQHAIPCQYLSINHLSSSISTKMLHKYSIISKLRTTIIQFYHSIHLKKSFHDYVP